MGGSLRPRRNEGEEGDEEEPEMRDQTDEGNRGDDDGVKQQTVGGWNRSVVCDGVHVCVCVVCSRGSERSPRTEQDEESGHQPGTDWTTTSGRTNSQELLTGQV